MIALIVWSRNIAFPGGDHDIVEQVVHEGQVKQGEVEEEESEEDNTLDPDAGLTHREVVELVQQLEHLTLRWGPNSPLTLELTHRLQDFRVFLRREELLNVKQVTIDTFFNHSVASLN